MRPAEPEAPLDESQREETRQTSEQLGNRQQRVAEAGGELLGAVFTFLGELVDEQDKPAPPPEVVSNLRSRLDECVEEDDSGRQRLTVTLPDRKSLDQLAQTLAGFLAVDQD